jgi:hypothetical protein
MSFIAAAIIGGGALVGGAISAYGANKAASTQAGAQMNAANIGYNEFNTITQQEQPFMNAGYGAQNELNYLMGQGGAGKLNKGTATPGGYGSLLQPFTQQQFKQYSPAYQFQQQQGMQGVLNQDASAQGAESGAASKDLINYNQSLAGTAFNNAFNQYQTQQGNIYQRLAGVAQLGQASAANTGQQGSALAANIGQSVASAGAAQAAGQVGQANAWSGALSSAAPWLAYGAGGQQQTPNLAGVYGPSTTAAALAEQGIT